MSEQYYSFVDTPCKGYPTCLGNKLARLAPLSDEHLSLLAKLEDGAVRVEKGSLLTRQFEPVDKIVILKEGWVASKSELPNGRSAITSIYYPGDIVGFEDLPFSRHNSTSVAASNLVCCKLDTSDLEQLLDQSPRLSALMMAYGAIEKAVVADRLIISRRRDGEARLALFLLQTMARLRLMNDNIYDQFYCPLNQQEIGEIIGITSVHVSRTLMKMEKLGLIARHKRFIKLLDEEELKKMSNFENRFENIDLAWLPEN